MNGARPGDGGDGGGSRWRIRAATAADLETLARVAASDPHGSWTRQSFASELGLAWSNVQVAEDVGDGTVVGLLVWWLVAGEIQLQNLATRSDRQRRGVGAWLMAHLLEEAEKLGATRIQLEVRSSNVAALALYRKLGFEVVGERPGYYDAGEEDAVLMDWVPTKQGPGR